MALRKNNANGDSYSSGGSFRHASGGEGGRSAETTAGDSTTGEGERARRRHVAPSVGEEKQRQQRQRQSGAATAPDMDAQAGREISDIDRRLGELHEFLKRAKEGGLGALPLPPPPPLTAESRLSQSPSVVDPSGSMRPPPAAEAGDEEARSSVPTAAAAAAAGAESTALELRDERSQSPPATDVGGQVGGLQKSGGSGGVDDAVHSWQEAGGAGHGTAAGGGDWHVDDVHT